MVHRRIATTEFGVLHDAIERASGRSVSIEITEGASTPAIRAAFEHTVALAERLEGPHVLSILDAGMLTDGTLVVVREPALATLASEARSRSIPLEEAVAWTLEASEAVAEAHALGLTHGRVRADNVYLARSDSDHPSAKVAFSRTTRAHATTRERIADVAGLAGLLQELIEGATDEDEGDAVRTLPEKVAQTIARATNGELHDVAAFAAELTPFAPVGHTSARTVEFLLARAGMLERTTPVTPHFPEDAEMEPSETWDRRHVERHGQGGHPAPPSTPSPRKRRIAWGIAGGILGGTALVATLTSKTPQTRDTGTTASPAPSENETSRTHVTSGTLDDEGERIAGPDKSDDASSDASTD